MNDPRQVQFSAEQIRSAAAGGLSLLNRETTLIPGDLRRQINDLELMLRFLAAGQAVLANPPPERVELDGKSEGSETSTDEDYDSG